MNNAIKMGLYFAVMALAWTINSIVVGWLSTWLIQNQFQIALYIGMGLSYPILLFITGYCFAKIVEIIRDIFRQSA